MQDIMDQFEKLEKTLTIKEELSKEQLSKKDGLKREENYKIIKQKSDL